MTIHDGEGNVIATSNPPDSRIFDNSTIQNAALTKLELESISFEGANIENSDFSGSDLYGATFRQAKCDSCKFVDADMRSSSVFDAVFRNSDMRGASFALDNTGCPVLLVGVDFSNSNLDGADFTGAIYDDTTIFPDGFDPASRGLRSKESYGPNFRRTVWDQTQKANS